MSKDKQIEEMANTYYEAMLKARGTLGSMNEGAPKWYAKHFYEAGYRKQSELTPCDVCKFNPPTSGDNKPCFICPAQAKGGAE